MIIIEENNNNNNNNSNNNVSAVLKVFSWRVLKILIVVAIIIIIIAGAIMIIEIDDGSFLEGDNSNTGNVVQQMALSNTNIDNIKPSAEGWNINVNLDTTVDDIIKELEENNGCVNDYIKEDKVKEYLTAFIKAELITQYPDLRSDPNKIRNGVPPEDGEFQGCIQIHRAASDATNGETQVLTYIDPTTFENYKTNLNPQILNHFTLTSDGNLIVAGWTRTTTNVTSNVSGVENIVDKVEFSLIEKSIPYKTVVDSYILPFDFLWAITVSGKDAEFAFNLAQLALESKIIFTVQDNLTTSIKTNIEEYKEEEKIQKQATLEVYFKDKLNEDGEPIKHQGEANILPTIKKSEIFKTETVTKTETCSINVDITEAKTWIVDYMNSYSNTIPNNPPTPGGEPEKLEDTDYVLVEQRVPLENDEEINNELLKFQIELCGSEENYSKQKEEDNIVAIANPQFYNKYKKTIEHTITNSTQTSYNNYVQGTPSVTEKTEEFTNLFNNSKSAKSNILSTSTWLFEMLENGPKTADMLDLVKYLLYKATNNDYGVKSFGLSIINLNDAKTVRGSSTENFIKSWENSSLWKYETQENAPFPTGYLTVDGLNYIVYEDGSNGHNNIAYGWATFISDSSNVQVNHPQYGGGYYNHKETLAAQGIIVEDLYEGALVSKEAANAAFENQILPFFEKEVESYLKDNLHGYNFSRSQKDALIAIAYQRGNIYGFKEAYIASLNEDGKVDSQKIAEKFIVNGEQVFSSIETINDRKYANWLLFTQEKYIDSAGNEIITRINLDDWDGDYYVAEQYTFPVYNQYDSRWASYPFGGPNSLPSVSGNNGKQKTISSSGCGCCSLAAVLSGYLGELITPDILTETLDKVYPTGSYYSPGEGSYCFYFYDNKLLKEFGVSGKSTNSEEEALKALSNGYAVIGGERGHIISYVPVSSEDAKLGYVFRIIDSARGHNALCKNFEDADLIVDGDASVTAIVYPYTD